MNEDTQNQYAVQKKFSTITYVAISLNLHETMTVEQSFNLHVLNFTNRHS